MHTKQGLRVLDLFCGAGGFAEGFRQAGFDIVAGNDIDPDACATFAQNFPEATCVWGDIRTPKIRRDLFNAAQEANIIVGGPPCQSFSQVRNHVRLIDDPRNSLYREFVAVVKELSPLAFVMENVQGLEQMGVKEQVLEDLSIKGKYIVRAQILDAADFGVPQTRKRLIFVGLAKSIGRVPPILQGTAVTRAVSLSRYNGSSPPHYELSLRQVSPLDLDWTSTSPEKLLRMLRDPRELRVVSAEQAIGDLSFLEAGRRLDASPLSSLLPATSAYQRLMRVGLRGRIENVQVPRMNQDTVLRLRGIPFGGNYRDLPEHLCERYITGEKWGPHNGTGKLGRRHFYAYRKLHPEIWSWTLNTKADAVYHYSVPRALSVREFARLQSFPDRFVFTTDSRRGLDLPGRIDGGAAHSRYRQVGNAVPPLLAKAIAEATATCVTKSKDTTRAA